jgi:hypothetical protein
MLCEQPIGWPTDIDWSGAGLLFSFCKLMFLNERISLEDSGLYIVAFFAGCWLVSLLLVALHLMRQHVSNSPLLKISQRADPPGLLGSIGLLCLWPVASGITGVMGVWLRILEPTIESCVAVGIAWQFALFLFFGQDSAKDDRQ